jgi:hypothetical protein
MPTALHCMISYCLLRRFKFLLVLYCVFPALLCVPAHALLLICSGGLSVPASRSCRYMHSCTLTYCCMSQCPGERAPQSLYTFTSLFSCAQLIHYRYAYIYVCVCLHIHTYEEYMRFRRSMLANTEVCLPSGGPYVFNSKTMGKYAKYHLIISHCMLSQ